jgi:hypothetical protein
MFLLAAVKTLPFEVSCGNVKIKIEGFPFPPSLLYNLMVYDLQTSVLLTTVLAKLINIFSAPCRTCRLMTPLDLRA